MRMTAAVLVALCAAACGGGSEMQAANEPPATECSGTFPPPGAVAPVQVGQNGGATETGPGC